MHPTEQQQIPPSRVRPQGGGPQDTPDEALFVAIVYGMAPTAAMLRDIQVDRPPPVTDLVESWRLGPLHEAVLHRLDAGLIDVPRVVLDTAHVRAKEEGEHTGPSPVDRDKPGSKMHVLWDANGLPLLVGVSAGNTHDSEG